MVRLLRLPGCKRILQAALTAAAAWLCLGQPSADAENAYTRFRYEHSKIVIDDPYPLAPGEIQLEVDYAYLNSSGQYGNSWSLQRRPELIRNLAILTGSVGVAEGIDVTAGIIYNDTVDFEQERRSGAAFSTILASSTLMLHYNDRSRLAIAYLPTFAFPIDSDTRLRRLEILPSAYAWSNQLVMSKDFGSYWTTNFQIGYIWPYAGDVGRARGSLVAGGAIGYQYFRWLQPVFEMLYIHEFRSRENDRTTISLLGGFVMPLSNQIRVDLGVLQDVAGRNTPNLTGLIANFTVTF